MKRTVCLALCLALTFCLLPPGALAAEGDPYNDMPVDGWAREAVLKAKEYGLMGGVSATEFGTGRSITRQEFVTILCRMFGWDARETEDAFEDIAGVWGRAYINAAAREGAVDAGGAFRPEEPITRREMAVMLVRSLGLADLASPELPLPFTDVTEDRGAVAVAYDIDMVNGTSPTTFDPEGGALREQAAAMLVRVYERYASETRWTHAFYAISSYSQVELAKEMDAVSFGWARLDYSGGVVTLNTTREGGNEYYVPQGYEDVVAELGKAGVKLHLSIFMNDVNGALSAFLEDPEAQSGAVGLILDEVKSLGLSGVTLDLEGLYAKSKDAFTGFAENLSTALRENGMTLFIAVMPSTADGVYYDGYDYRALAGCADKLLLMAHNYAPLSMPEELLGSEFYKNAALTPIASVYRSLRDITDRLTGVEDLSKIAINLSMTAMAWETDEAGKLVSTAPVYLDLSTVYSRLASGARMGWSDSLKNPYLTYVTEEGKNVFLWYEDERSVEAKLDIARLLGVTSVSVWRLGLVPDYADEGLYFNVADTIAPAVGE